jgi:putative SOS response-associated peptidase YedK
VGAHVRGHHVPCQRPHGAHPRPHAGVPPIAYERWLANVEPDPRDLLVPFPSEPMAMWPISTRVNKPENDDAVILDRIEAAAQP